METFYCSRCYSKFFEHHLGYEARIQVRKAEKWGVTVEIIEPAIPICSYCGKIAEVKVSYHSSGQEASVDG